ncbi:MAG: type II toxin-antitoxin system RelE/ParE family toxin [Chloracidobacterium sp.]|nr:type II toxin-antitoxin system RelE/ParE family toxin [Chloracidobacterium sp.]
MRLVKLPQALTDLIETAEYLAEDDIETADRFFDAFEATLNDLCRTPKMGAVRRFREMDVRMWFVRDFSKILIFYTERADEIVILRVIHSARDYTRFFEAD